MTLDDLNQVLAAICLFFLLWNAYILLFNRGIPNIRTASAIRTHIIEILQDDIARKETKQNYTILDLGAGNGLLTRSLAHALPEAHVIGLEWSWIACLLARFHAWRKKIRNVQYLRTDFFKYDFSRADAIVLYLTASEMTSIGEKLKKEAKPGAMIFSNRFALRAGWQPQEVKEINSPLYPLQKKLYVYQKKDEEFSLSF